MPPITDIADRETGGIMTFQEWVDSYADQNIAFGWHSEKSYVEAMRLAWDAGRKQGLVEVWEKMITKLGKPLSHSEANVYTKLWDECRAAYEKHQAEAP